jgi:hypothetical protein
VVCFYFTAGLHGANRSGSHGSFVSTKLASILSPAPRTPQESSGPDPASDPGTAAPVVCDALAVGASAFDCCRKPKPPGVTAIIFSSKTPNTDRALDLADCSEEQTENRPAFEPAREQPPQ